MSSLFRKLEDYNNQHRGCVRKILSFAELLFLLFSIPLTYFIYVLISQQRIIISLYEFIVLTSAILITWYTKEMVNSQAKIPRAQRNLYIIFYHFQAYFITSMGLIALKIIFRLENIPILFLLIYLSIFFSVTIIFKLIGYRFLKIYRANGYNLHYVLIIADGFSDQTIDKLLDQKEWGFKILGIVTNSRLISKKYGESIAIIPESEDLSPILGTIVIDEIIYSKYKIDENQVAKIMQLCNEIGIIFRLQSSISPIEPENFQFKTLNQSKFLKLADIPSNHFTFLIKTIGDYYLSILAMVLLFPLFLFISLIIKIDSKGPVLFKQERIGLRGRKFVLYKFRTMVENAENKLIDLKANNETDGIVFKIKEDPRITRVGRFLRRTGLDELPQLLNVVLGEMSLIGPRPPLPCEVEQYKRWQLRRLSVKPGITCTWQVAHNRNDVKFENWMKMDLNYIDNWSLSKDMSLIFRTIAVFFFADGR